MLVVIQLGHQEFQFKATKFKMLWLLRLIVNLEKHDHVISRYLRIVNSPLYIAYRSNCTMALERHYILKFLGLNAFYENY